MNTSNKPGMEPSYWALAKRAAVWSLVMAFGVAFWTALGFTLYLYPRIGYTALGAITIAALWFSLEWRQAINIDKEFDYPIEEDPRR